MIGSPVDPLAVRRTDVDYITTTILGSSQNFADLWCEALNVDVQELLLVVSQNKTDLNVGPDTSNLLQFLSKYSSTFPHVISDLVPILVVGANMDPDNKASKELMEMLSTDLRNGWYKPYTGGFVTPVYMTLETQGKYMDQLEFRASYILGKCLSIINGNEGIISKFLPYYMAFIHFGNTFQKLIDSSDCITFYKEDSPHLGDVLHGIRDSGEQRRLEISNLQEYDKRQLDLFVTKQAYVYQKSVIEKLFRDLERGLIGTDEQINNFKNAINEDSYIDESFLEDQIYTYHNVQGNITEFLLNHPQKFMRSHILIEWLNDLIIAAECKFRIEQREGSLSGYSIDRFLKDKFSDGTTMESIIKEINELLSDTDILPNSKEIIFKELTRLRDMMIYNLQNKNRLLYKDPTHSSVSKQELSEVLIYLQELMIEFISYSTHGEL